MELTEEDIKKNLKEIIENPEKYKTEYKYILEIEEFERDSGEFPHYRKSEIIKGSAEVIEIDRYTSFDMRYRTYILITKEIGTIVRIYEFQRLSDFETEEKEEYYIFTRNGWVKVELK
jgi:hypothetical protein